MRFRYAILFVLAALFVIPAHDAYGRRLKRKFARQMTGTYYGRIRGYGNDGVSDFSLDVPGGVIIGIGVRGVQGASGLTHRIKFRRPTGRARNARFKGVYKGTFTNPDTMTTERVRGARIANVRKKGHGRKARYTVRYRDFLTEGSLAYWRLRGRGKKR